MRQPESQPNCLALVVKAAAGSKKVKNFLIKCESTGFRVSNLSQPTLGGLIAALATPEVCGLVKRVHEVVPDPLPLPPHA